MSDTQTTRSADVQIIGFLMQAAKSIKDMCRSGGTNTANTLFSFHPPMPIVSSNGSAAITGGHFFVGQFIAASTPPTGKTFPYGVFEFTAQTAPGGAVSISITYPQALPTNARYLKLIHGAWVDYRSIGSRD